MGARGNSTDHRVGGLLGGWQIESVLGHGASSTVYAASLFRLPGGPPRRAGDLAPLAVTDPSTRVAIKVLHAHLAREPEIVEHFLVEGRLCRTIRHPGVVKTLEEGIADDGVPYLVFELLVGQNLEELRHSRGGRVPIEEVMTIADAIMATLAEVHDAGIVHRDLKPQNVVLLDGGGVKIVDFGVAKVRGNTVDAIPNVVGTPSFMPPEQALGLPKKMDAQSDIWALGATLFLLLSGQPVHLARHSSAMLLASASMRPRSLADAAPELPRRIVEVVDRALAFRKAERWPNVRAMRSAWQEAHPSWLPTLPPPKFAAEPNKAEASFERGPSIPHHTSLSTPFEMTVSDLHPRAPPMFDPRELARDAEEAVLRAERARDNDSRPLRGSEDTTQGPPVRRRARTAAAVALVGLALATAAKVRFASHGGAPLAATTPPPSAMEIPSAVRAPAPATSAHELRTPPAVPRRRAADPR